MTTTERVLEFLRKNAEGSRMANKDGSIWADVYLDNARPEDLSVTAFRSCLSGLSKLGVYKVVDGWAWGSVKMN